MNLEKVELIIHPVRLRILQALVGEQLTTQEIAEQMPDVPKSSIYRHLKLLLDGEMIALAETRLVNGIQEKVYALARAPRVEREDVAGISAEAHFGYFTTYILTLLRDFANYLTRSAGEDGHVDMTKDYAGYTEAAFFASEEELLEFYGCLNAALKPLADNGPAPGRRKHKIAVVTHPTGNRPVGVGMEEGALRQDDIGSGD